MKPEAPVTSTFIFGTLSDPEGMRTPRAFPNPERAGVYTRSRRRSTRVTPASSHSHHGARPGPVRGAQAHEVDAGSGLAAVVAATVPAQALRAGVEAQAARQHAHLAAENVVHRAVDRAGSRQREVHLGGGAERIGLHAMESEARVRISGDADVARGRRGVAGIAPREPLVEVAVGIAVAIHAHPLARAGRHPGD